MKDFKGTIFAHIVAVLVVAVWGTTFVSSKVLITHGMEPASIFFFRFLMAYVCIIFVSHKRLFASNLLDELTLLCLGMMGGSLYFLSENMALKYSTASNVGILVGTTPLLTALILALFYKSERMMLRQVCGSLVAFVGMVLVILNGQLVLHLNPLGDALALGASLTWALYSLCMKRVMGRYSVDFITRKVFGYGLLTILPYFIWVSPLQSSWQLLSTPVVAGNLLFLGFVASLGCYLVWNWVMARIGAVTATNYIYSQTLVTMAVATIVLHERITLMAVAGAVILIVGMWRMKN